MDAEALEIISGLLDRIDALEAHLAELQGRWDVIQPAIEKIRVRVVPTEEEAIENQRNPIKDCYPGTQQRRLLTNEELYDLLRETSPFRSRSASTTSHVNPDYFDKDPDTSKKKI